MKTRACLKMKWLTLAFLAGLTSGVLAEDPIAVYEIGWDNGDGGSQNGEWHTVPKLIQGNSTLQLSNQQVKSAVQAGTDGMQVFSTEVDGGDADLIAFTEPTNSTRRYVLKGEARCENVNGQVLVTMGVANSNYAGNVAKASTPDGSDKWEGTRDWQSFTLVCDAPPPAMPPPGTTTPNHFIAELGLKRTGTGTFYLRNLRFEVYGKDLTSATTPANPATPATAPRLFESLTVASFGAGLGVGVLSCLIFLRFYEAHRRSNHEKELRRMASVDASGS
jgi:hypothetical protein